MTDSGGTTPAPIVGDHRHGYQRGTYADETSASFTVPYSGDAMVIATQISLSAAFAREISGFIAGRPDRHLPERQRPSDAARAVAGHTAEPCRADCTGAAQQSRHHQDRKSTRLNSSH